MTIESLYTDPTLIGPENLPQPTFKERIMAAYKRAKRPMSIDDTLEEVNNDGFEEKIDRKRFIYHLQRLTQRGVIKNIPEYIICSDPEFADQECPPRLTVPNKVIEFLAKMGRVATTKEIKTYLQENGFPEIQGKNLNACLSRRFLSKKIDREAPRSYSLLKPEK